MVRLYIACLCIVFIACWAGSATAQTFQSLPVDLVGSYSGRMKWVDLDNDKDLDLLYNGEAYNGLLDFRTSVYENVAGEFVPRNTAIPGLWGTGIIPGDFDNDGDYDVLVTGIGPEPGPWTQYSNTTELYENRGDFTFVFKQSFFDLMNSTAAWIDLENDGDLDLILSGVDDTRDDVPMINLTFVYENTGSGFTLLPDAGIAGCGQCFMECADSNGDGKVDVLMTGMGPLDYSKTSLYINNGNKTFHEDTSIPIPDMFNGDSHWGDFDNDGDQDILICGATENGGGVFTGIYENTPAGFIERTDINLFQIGNANFAGIIGWAAFDNDGFLDIAVSGIGNMYLYRNNQHGNFEPLTGSVFENVANLSIDFGDYDNDGDIDIAYLGQSYVTFGPVAGIYKNRLLDAPFTTNTQPLPPPIASLSESFHGKDVLLHWGKGSDTQTPAAGLDYNFYLRSAAEKYATPPVDHATGFLRTDNPVNANSEIARVSMKAEGQFYWAVQSVDGGGVGSRFTAEKNFYKFNGPTATAAVIVDPGHVKLSWIDNSTLEENYVISRSLASSTGYEAVNTVNENVTSYVDADAFAGDTYYYYRIHAQNATTSSSYDSLVVLIPTSPATLSGTTILAASITLQWEDRSAYETGYAIERSLGGEDLYQVLAQLPAGTSTYTDGTVSEGAQYEYRVRATNAYGSSAYSNTLTVQANVRPMGKDFVKSVAEDDTLSLAKSDFINSFSDTDVADALAHIVVRTLPQTGILYREETPVNLGQIVPLNELDGLVFIPAANMNGTESFTFLVNDGRDDAANATTVTITVTPVNDPPVLSSFPDVSISQKPFASIQFTISDIDDPVASLTIIATSADTLLIKNKKITFSKAAPWSMTIVPELGKVGSTVITIRLTDGKDTVSRPCNVAITLSTNPGTDPGTVTGIDDTDAMVQVYPNPATSALTVAVAGVPHNRSVAILLDVSGHEVKRLSLNANGTVGLEDLAPGVYLLRVLQDDTLLRQVRIVKR